MRAGYPSGSQASPGGGASSGSPAPGPSGARVRAHVLAAALAMGLGLQGCLDGGGGTETESAGILRNSDGSPAVAVRVQVRPSDYLADSERTGENADRRFSTSTDNGGRFRFVDLPPGPYRLEAEDGGRGTVADFTLLDKDHKIALPVDTLRPHGSIYGTFAPDSNPTQGRFVQVYGLERLIRADSVTGGFQINNLPPGTYSLRFLGLEPFRKQAVRETVQVVSGEVRHLEPVHLAEEAKLTFHVPPGSGSLVIDGMGPGSPLILDNEFWDNGVENEYVWAKAGRGLLDLRGNLVTDALGPAATLDAQLAKARGELRLARLAGMGGVPDPLPGSRRRLRQDDPGRLEDIAPERSQGSDLIVAEARKATPDSPLVVVAGGPLTTIANAYLTDPSIATRMVVAAIYPFSVNSRDTLAAYLVAKRCRLVVWGGGYIWRKVPDAANMARLPGNLLGERVRDMLYPGGRPGRVSLGDLAPVAFLFRPGTWTGASRARISPALTVQPASALSFDFLDIPEAANAWDAFQEEFFASLADASAYAPAPVPGRLEAEGYSARSGARPIVSDPGSVADTSMAHDAMRGTAGAWMEVRAAADTARSYAVSVRCRSSAGGRLAIGAPGGPFLAELAVPAGAAWTLVDANVMLVAGTQNIRIAWSAGAIDVDWVELR